MDTKHCQRCHKLLRADARSCSRCGYVFSQAPVRRIASNGSHRSDTASMPSNPPASPHRAGHYSGLHPEDQPFQSSFIPVQRPAPITRRLVEQEPDEALLPAATATSTALPLTPLHEPEQSVPEQLPKRKVATPSPLPLPMPQRTIGSPSPLPVPLLQRQFAVPALPTQSPASQEITTPVSEAFPLPHKSQLHKHIVPVLLLASLIFALLGTSALAFQLINKRPLVPVQPALNDVSTAATPQQAPTTSTNLQLSPSPTVTRTVSPTSGNLSLVPASLSFNGTPAQNPSIQALIVQNTGGQALDWTAIVGNSTGGNWLSVPYASGHLAAHLHQTLFVSANSAGLSVGPYQGSLTFSYAGGPSLQVLVTLTVSPTPLPGMGVSSNALQFSAIQGIDPQPQTFSVTNTGNGPLHWAITKDASGTAFVPVSPPRGTVPPGKSVTITVRPHVAQATAGIINARITISDTDQGTPVQSQQVTVAITISSQAVISVSSTSLAFNQSSTTSNSTQLLVITNTGSAPLNWTLSQPLPSWLSVDIPGGTLPSGASTFVNVTCDSSGLPPGIYPPNPPYKLVVSDTDAGTPVRPQDVQVTLTVT